MADYAGAYGAGGAADALRQLLADKLVREKFNEQKRHTKVEEDAQEANRRDTLTYRQQEADAAARRDESARQQNYEQRQELSRQFNTRMQQDTNQEMVRYKEHADDRETGLETERKRQEFQAGENQKNRSLQMYLAGQNKTLQNELTGIRIQEEKAKQQAAQEAKDKEAAQAKESSQSAYDSVRKMLDPNGIGAGLDSSYGAYEMRGFTQPARNFKAERNRLVNMLALPNLGMLKGSMSDKDLVFLKNIQTNLADDNIDENMARDELKRLSDFLEAKGAGVRLQAPDGTVKTVPAAQVQHFLSLGAKPVQ